MQVCIVTMPAVRMVQIDLLGLSRLFPHEEQSMSQDRCVCDKCHLAHSYLRLDCANPSSKWAYVELMTYLKDQSSGARPFRLAHIVKGQVREVHSCSPTVGIFIKLDRWLSFQSSPLLVSKISCVGKWSTHSTRRFRSWKQTSKIRTMNFG